MVPVELVKMYWVMAEMAADILVAQATWAQQVVSEAIPAVVGAALGVPVNQDRAEMGSITAEILEVTADLLQPDCRVA